MEQFEKFLSLFFTQVSQLYFDKSRELVEREREITRSGQMRQFISQLSNFVEAERLYYNLGFLSVKNKIFLRKDNSLKSMYECLKCELHRLEDAGSNDRLLNTIINQLSQYLTARVQLVDLYEKMYSMGTGMKPVKYDDLQSQVEVIVEMHTFSFPHPILSPAKAAITWECEVLRNLLGAQVEIQLWNFVSSLIHLHAANTQLALWEKSLQGKESWKLGFGTGFLKGSQLPPLYHWLLKLKSAIVSKFSLYFYQTLYQQSSQQEMKALLANKHVTDYYHKLQNLQRRCMATTALLVFETTKIQNWGGPSYKHPERPTEPPIDNYLIMLSHSAKPIEQMGSVRQALVERSPDHILAEKVICLYNNRENATYFMSSLDPRVTLVLLFESKKEEKEITMIHHHINEFCAQIRCFKVFASLKVSK